MLVHQELLKRLPRTKAFKPCRQISAASVPTCISTHGLSSQHRQPNSWLKHRGNGRALSLAARKRKDNSGESFFVFDEETSGDEPPGPADDVQDDSVTGYDPPAPEVEALSLRTDGRQPDLEPAVADGPDEAEDGQFWADFFKQAQNRQTQQHDKQPQEQVGVPAVQEKTIATLNIGDQDVDFLIKPEHYLEVIESPFRYDTSVGAPVQLEMGEVDDLPNLEEMTVDELADWAIVVERERKYRRQWEEEEYLEQYFEISSRHNMAEVNRFSAVQRLATITRNIELQDEAGVMPERLQRIPPFVRANLVFDREFDWYNSQFDENLMSKRAQNQELDETRVFGNIMVPEEMLAEHPLLGLEAKKAKEEAVDPLHRYLVGVLPGTATDGEREERQQQLVTDLLGEELDGDGDVGGEVEV